MPDGSHTKVDKVLDDTHALAEYLQFMKGIKCNTTATDQAGHLMLGNWRCKRPQSHWAVWYHVGQHIEIKADKERSSDTN